MVNNYFDGIAVGSKQKVIFFLVMLGYFFDQMDNFNFGIVSKSLLERGFLQEHQIDTVLSIYLAGMLIGSFVGGYLSDVFGRKKTLTFSIGFFSICSIINGLAPNPIVFAVSRFLTGIGLLCMTTVSMTYIAEMAPAESRGKWQALIGAIGFFSLPLIAIINKNLVGMEVANSWRIIFLLGGLGVIPFIASFYFLKESPRWLVSKGRVLEAEGVIEEITGKKVKLLKMPNQDENQLSRRVQLKELFQAKYYTRTVVLLFISSILTSQTLYLFNKIGTILPYNEVDTARVLVITMFGPPLASFFAAYVSDKGGRKIPLVFLSISLAVLNIVFSVVVSHYVNSIYVVMGLLLLLLIHLGMLAVINFSYIAESYKTSVRNTAVGFIMCVSRFVSAFAVFGFTAVHGMYGNFGFFVLMAVLMALFSFTLSLWGERTGGKALEEIN